MILRCVRKWRLSGKRSMINVWKNLRQNLRTLMWIFGEKLSTGFNVYNICAMILCITGSLCKKIHEFYHVFYTLIIRKLTLFRWRFYTFST